MSVVDVLLIVLALVFALSGFRQGLLVSSTSILGFLGGAVIGAQLSGPVTERIDGSSVTRVFAALVVVATVAPSLSRPARSRSMRPRTWVSTAGTPASAISSIPATPG